MLVKIFRSLVESSKSFGGTLRGFVLLEVHVQDVYIVFGDKSMTVYDVPYFPWEGKEWEGVVAHDRGTL